MNTRHILLENSPQRNFMLLVQQNKIDPQIAKKIKDIDPHPKKAFSFWMALQWISKQVTNMTELQKTIEKFYEFVKKGKTTITVITQLPEAKEFTFNALKAEVTKLEKSASAVSKRDAKLDYETIVDDENLLIIVPHTREASHSLGMNQFKHRVCSDGSKDSVWCTTHKSSNEFNNMYHKHHVTLYYIKVKSQQLLKKLKSKGYGPEYAVVAVAILSDENSQQLSDAGHHNREAYDAKNNRFKDSELDMYLEIIGVE
jgi:hypothetical protein